jgi:hypothetical protein
MLGAGRLNAGEAVKTALALYMDSQNSGGITGPDLDDWSVDFDVMGDGNNGHGNDEGGFDPSNPGQGNGNNGNGRPGNNNNDDDSLTTTKKSTKNNGVYDMSGRKVKLEWAPSGMYLVVENGVVVRKIWK